MNAAAFLFAGIGFVLASLCLGYACDSRSVARKLLLTATCSVPLYAACVCLATV